jgi:hypothetical protein
MSLIYKKYSTSLTKRVTMWLFLKNYWHGNKWSSISFSHWQCPSDGDVSFSRFVGLLILSLWVDQCRSWPHRRHGVWMVQGFNLYWNPCDSWQGRLDKRSVCSSSSSAHYSPLLDIGLFNFSPSRSILGYSHPAPAWGLAWGRPTLRLPRRGLHSRTRLPQRLSVLWLI